MEFLTVKQAAERSGKSASSIRRILYPILQQDSHPDRIHIQPGVEDAKKLRTQGENFAWRVSEELLDREVPRGAASEKGSPAQGGSSPAEAQLLAILRSELQVKNEQIAQSAATIAALNERLREGNILMGRLQQQLALPDGRGSKPPEAVKAKRTKTTEKGSTMSATPAKARKGFLSRLFGRPQ